MNIISDYRAEEKNNETFRNVFGKERLSCMRRGFIKARNR